MRRSLQLTDSSDDADHCLSYNRSRFRTHSLFGGFAALRREQSQVGVVAVALRYCTRTRRRSGQTVIWQRRRDWRRPVTLSVGKAYERLSSQHAVRRLWRSAVDQFPTSRIWLAIAATEDTHCSWPVEKSAVHSRLHWQNTRHVYYVVRSTKPMENSAKLYENAKSVLKF